MRDEAYASHVIQRGAEAYVDSATDGEAGVLEFEGLRASFFSGRVEVLGWSQEPVEGHDNEVDEVCVEGSPLGMRCVKDLEEGLDDGKVCRAGPRGRVVFIGESLDETSQYGMVPVGSWRRLSGIPDAQVGHPLAHCQ